MSDLRARHLRLLLLCAFALAVAALLWLLFGAANSALVLWQQLRALPAWIRVPGVFGLAALAVAAIWAAWRLLHPRPRRVKVLPMPDRSTIEQRVNALAVARADTAHLEDELRELDRRRLSGECYVAVFGEISAGKSSLIRALAPESLAAVDVLGGTTSRVSQHHGTLDDGRRLTLADVPGTQEIGGQQREALARDEALRAHAVIYVVAGDLSRQQDAELRWLRGFGKPLVLALNKTDLWNEDERRQLLAALRARYADVVDALVSTRGGGLERLQRVLADGRREAHTRPASADVDLLRKTLVHITAMDPAALEQARERAVLGGMHARIGNVENELRDRQTRETIERYTRRAIIGALAAVAPGTDLVIQGALATGLVRELARIHSVPVRDLDLDAFLAQAAINLRTTSSLVLAIAGNALKAFPGLGTLGGGVLHAIAYGLIFDSLGHAIAHTLAAQQQLDQEQAMLQLRRLLGGGVSERLGHVAQIAMRALREPDSAD